MTTTTEPITPLLTGPQAMEALALTAEAEARADAEAWVVQRPYDPDEGDKWLVYAQCGSQDPEIFHPVSAAAKTTTPRGLRPTVEVATEVCAGCPVIAACRERRYQLGATGVWGGVHYESSAALRVCAHHGCRDLAKNSRTRYCGFDHEHAEVVGTRRGYDLHRRAGVDACGSCIHGQRAELRKYARRPGLLTNPNNRGAGGRHRGAGRM